MLRLTFTGVLAEYNDNQLEKKITWPTDGWKSVHRGEAELRTTCDTKQESRLV